MREPMNNKIPIIELSANSSDNQAKALKANAKSAGTQSSNVLLASINAGKIYTKKVNGYYQRLRQRINYLLLAVFFLLPWIDIAGRQSVLFDLSAQRFHIFNVTYWPQEGGYLAGLLLLATFLLVASTVVVGRAWCGFVCPQTVWTVIFMWIEQKCEGDRNQRIKLDNQINSMQKLSKKALKHILWLIVSVITAYTFVGYFYDISDLVAQSLTMDTHYLAVFWIIFFISGTYLNAGWLREKVCLHMCPYARFQAVMYAKETLVVSYDQQRGEARGKTQISLEQGDCVDCGLCVKVCPVGIDIRNGLQYPCINCGLCIDACDKVMLKVGLKPGLIKFSHHQTQHKPSYMSFFGHKIPNIFVLFAALSLLACLGFVYSIVSRVDLAIDIRKERSGQLYHRVNSGIENIYTLKVKNLASPYTEFELGLVSATQLQLMSEKHLQIKEGKEGTFIVRVWGASADINTYKQAITFKLTHVKSNWQITEPSTFIAPN
jgi:cytochrome c oxidase accessory protein FixG